ncbi:unnamed protein product [Cylindrotheca closterium]|uniref:protein-tyrosine-phosphatase n=1 Tax=Cylindrotheca closterium TaxID=2856 RepID=A0AAD2CH25_9STRA|nr:unnamed protein product [Cylindrotheca closterium]
MPGAPPPTNASKNPLRGAVEILPDALYYAALSTPPSSSKILLRNKKNQKIPVMCFCIDATLVYWNFFLDFGPLNLGQLYRFRSRLNELLQQANRTTVTSAGEKPAILFYSSAHPAKRTNAVYLICAWQVLELRRSPEQAFFGFSYYNTGGKPPPTPNSMTAQERSLPPTWPLSPIGEMTVARLPTFHDASPVQCNYNLNIMHCLHGLKKAMEFGFFDFKTFNVDEYEYFEQVENGDLNWIVQGKILAFAGPSFQKKISPEGYCTLAPSDYIPYFQKRNVGLVVRLNKKMYEEQDFIRAGIQHLHQFYIDGSCPPMDILQNVVRSFEEVPKGKAFAVHCKAGLGRTGTCIGAYLMKHYRMTAPEVIAWQRICRPGMVIGPQQQFLEDIQNIMWQEGQMMYSSPITQHLSTSRIPSPNKSTRRPYPEPRTPQQQQQLQLQQQTPPPQTSEAVHGIPGQADGLLARRKRGEQQSNNINKPVPVTPDTSITSDYNNNNSPQGT